MKNRAVPEFRAHDGGRALLLTTRPLVTEDCSIELQRMTSAVLPPVFRRWHLISIVLSSETAIERHGSGWRHASRFASGDASIRGTGGFESVIWHEPIEALHLHVSPQRMAAAARRLSPDEDVVPSQSVRLRDPVVAEAGRALRDVMRLDFVARRRTAGPLIDELLEHLLLRYGAPARRSTRCPAGLLGPSLDLIHREPGERLSVDRLARAAGLTPFAFLRRFPAVTGMTPHQYVLRTRFERAKHLLSGEDSIAAVAHACGFSDQSHLTRVFRALGATTPAKFRAAQH